MDESRMRRRYHSLEEMIQDNYGSSVFIIRTDSVRGGDINNAYRSWECRGHYKYVCRSLTKDSSGRLRREKYETVYCDTTFRRNEESADQLQEKLLAMHIYL